MTIKNNYETFKTDFKKDTGLDYNKDTVSEYLQYLNFRTSDNQMQILISISNELFNLPDIIRLRMGEMIASHDTFKSLLKKLDNLK